MNTAIWTVARRLALSADRRQRWRQISVVLGAAIATCAILLAASVVRLGLAVTDHTDARHPTVDAASFEDKLLFDVTGPVLSEVSQFPLMWIDPLPGFEDDPAVVPPGLSEVPAPGEAVLSPGLVAHGYEAEDFGFDTSSAGTGHEGAIGDDGLASRSEGLIYARVADGRSIADDGSLSSGFGLPGAHASIETVLDVPSAQNAIVGATWLLFLPAILVMAGSARAVSQVRTQRAETLWRLGIARSTIGSLVATEALVLAAIGAAAGAAVWATGIAPRTTLPGIGAELTPGALTLPWPVALAVVVLTLAIATLASIQLRQERRRPRAAATVLSVAPFAACLAMMTVAGVAPRWFGTSYDLGIGLLILAGVGTTVTLPMAIPPLLGGMDVVGRLIRRPPVWLAGRLVVTRRRTLARPAVMAATLVYLAGACTAMIQGLTLNPPASVLPTAERSVWSVTWSDARDSDQAAVIARTEMAGAVVLPVALVPFEESKVAESGPRTQGLISLPDCEAAQHFFGMGPQSVQCEAGGATVEGTGYGVSFGPVVGGDEVLISTPPSWTESDVLTAFTGLPAVSTWKLAGSNDFHFPAYDWYAAAMIAATGLLAIGLIRELGDRVIVVVGERSRLLRAGLHSEEADWVYGLATMLPVVVTLPLGYLAARVFAANGVGYSVTADSLDVIAVVAASVAVVAVAVVAATLWWQQRIDSAPRPRSRTSSPPS